MIFRELNAAEIRILKLLRMHLTLTHETLARYMEMGLIELHKPMNHLEREGLISVDRSGTDRGNAYLGRGTIYCPTAKGLGLARDATREEI